MKVFFTKDLEELYTTGRSRKYNSIAKNRVMFNGYVRAVQTMIQVGEVDDLKGYSFLHYEQLRHELSGYSSVRLSNAYIHRLIFRETEEGLTIELIEIDNTHYGNKR